jgi:hypothetical protein
MPVSPLEKIICDREYYGLKATKCQHAIARAVDGFAPGALWNDPDVRSVFRGVKPVERAGHQSAAEIRPFEILLAAGIRGFKSMLAAGLALDRAVNCDLSGWSEKEAEPILPVLSVRKENARAVFEHVRGLATHSPFREHLAGPPTADSIVIVHPDTGTHIRIVVKAGSRAASSLASFWLVSAVFDECFKMTGREESVLNLEDAQVEVRERVIKGGQVIYIGSKWRPEGPAYRMFEDSWGKPTRRRLVMNATGPMLNPSHWTPARCERLEESQDAQDKEIFVTSVLGQFLEADEQLLSVDEIQNVTRAAPVEQPPIPGVEYVAAMDPATRRNTWTLVIAGRWEPHRVGIAVAREWVPTGVLRLDPDEVLREIAEVCASYNIYRVFTDQWSLEGLQIVAGRFGMALIELPSQNADVTKERDAIRLHVQRKTIELPPCETLQRDLLRMRKKPLPTGGMRIILPETSDGRHCDFVPPLAQVLARSPRWNRDDTLDVRDDAEIHEERMRRGDGPEWLDELSAQFG